jgi:hypothetical protein
MLWNDRHRDSREFDALPDTETVTDTDGHGYARAHADPHPGRHNQCGNEHRKFLCYTQWLSQSAWNNHDGLLSVWPDHQLRLDYRHANSDWHHRPAC